MPVLLYHHPGSLCSQKVRLALAEKGVPYEARVIDIGPRGQNFEPWYARLNPHMVVPTLVHDGAPVTDSARIVRYIDERFDGPALHAEDEAGKAAEARWMEVADRLPMRELSYGRVRGPLGWILRRSDRLRLRKLARHRDENPELRELYEAKMEEVRRWFATSRDPVQVGAILARVDEALGALDAHLEGRSFIGGERYGVADVLWTVVLGRLCALGQGARVAARSNVQAYLERMKARPSFEEASVWDRVPWLLILKSMLGMKPASRAGAAAGARA